MRKQLGLFGGTFDPIHLGHTRMATAFAKELSLSEVVFIPAGDPYHKEQIIQTSAIHRLQMVQLAIEDNAAFSVSDCDITRQGKTYTTDTLGYFKQTLPAETTIWWLMGSDSLLQLHTWYKYQEIFELCNIAIAMRDDFSLSLLNPKLAALCKEALNKQDSNYGMMRLLMLSPLQISSFQVRKKIREHKDVSPYLNPKVVQYIERHHLYQSN